MIDVVHVIETLGTGGAEHLLHTNVKHLDPARVRSTVVTLSSRDHDWAEPIRRLGVPVVSLDCDVPSGLLRATVRLRRLVKKGRPDLIHTHIWSSDIAGRIAGRTTGIPVISSVHNTAYEPRAWTEDPGVRLRTRVLLRQLDRWTARFGCRRMIAVSEVARTSTMRWLGVPAERIDVLENPIDFDELDRPPRQSRAELLRALGLPPGSVVLLNVGRVVPPKGLLYAVRALPGILKRHPAVRLVAVGSTANARWVDGIMGEATRLGLVERLHLLGPRDDVPDLLRACDLFVFPSLSEGLGIALIEAMALGCPCVASDIRPLSDLIRHGVDGWLVRPRDPAAIADAVSALLEDPARRLNIGEKARRGVRARFDPVAAAARLHAIYEFALGRGPRPLDAMTTLPSPPRRAAAVTDL